MAHIRNRCRQASKARNATIFRSDDIQKKLSSYIPDLLSHRPFVFEADVVTEISAAEHAVVRLNQQTLVDAEALNRLLLRANAVASSRIDGIDVGTWRLLRADAAQQLGEPADDPPVGEVLANIQATNFAMCAGDAEADISVDRLLETHRLLLAATHPANRPGCMRDARIKNAELESARFEPPHHEMLEMLLDDLCAFCNKDSLPALAQAAIAHAQFETIRPFVAGNGRVGRALIHMILRRRGLMSRVSTPVCLGIAERIKDYEDGLSATRYAGVNALVRRLASACRSAVAQAEAFATQTHQMQIRRRQRLESVRAGSATDLLLKKLAGIPVLTVQSAAELVGRSFQAANEAVARLVEARILVPAKAGRRNRAFEAPDLMNAFVTLISSRRVPYT